MYHVMFCYCHYEMFPNEYEWEEVFRGSCYECISYINALDVEMEHGSDMFEGVSVYLGPEEWEEYYIEEI